MVTRLVLNSKNNARRLWYHFLVLLTLGQSLIEKKCIPTQLYSQLEFEGQLIPQLKGSGVQASSATSILLSLCNNYRLSLMCPLMDYNSGPRVTVNSYHGHGQICGVNEADCRKGLFLMWRLLLVANVNGREHLGSCFWSPSGKRG